MDYLLLEGTSYQIGVQKAKFDGNYLDDVMKYYGKDDNPAFTKWIKNKAIPYVEGTYSEIASEIQGYSDTSGYDKVFLFKYYFSQAKQMFECTNIAAYTEDAGFILAKNTDLQYREYDNIFFYHYKPDNGYEFFVYDYKASFGGQGMNIAGFCQGGTSQAGIIEASDANQEVGIPAAFISRENMQYTNTSSTAEETWKNHQYFDKPMAGICLDRNGNCSQINRSKTLCDIKTYKQFPVYCSGFFDSEKYQLHSDFQGSLEWSRAAREYAKKYFAKKNKIYLQDIVDFLRSHGPDWSKYGQWCRHYPQDRWLCTVVSHICIPAQRKVLYCHGNPCQNSYKEFSFDKS